MSAHAMDGSGQWRDFDYSTGGANTTSATDLIICSQEQGSPLPISMTTANVLRYIQTVYYLICFPTAVLLNTRNQDVKEVLQQIFAKLKKKREILTTSHSGEENSTTVEIQNPVYEQDNQ